MRNYTFFLFHFPFPFLLIFFIFFILSYFPPFLFILITKSQTKSRMNRSCTSHSSIKSFNLSFSSPPPNFAWIKRSLLSANFHDPRDPSTKSICQNPSRGEEREKLKARSISYNSQVHGLMRTKDGRIGRREVHFLKMEWTPSAARADPSFLIKLSEARFLVPRGEGSIYSSWKPRWKLLGLSSFC